MIRSHSVVIFTFLTGAFGLLLFTPALAQSLKPGFDPVEYSELLKVSAQFGDSTYTSSFPKPERFKSVYRSPDIGLDNKWDLWVDGTTAVINIRGTTANSTSWLANFYAAMIPAKGELQLSDTETFSYALSNNPRAAVHVGWMVGTGFLVKDILPKLDDYYKRGVKNWLIMGHSQGGSIAFLLTAHLYSLKRQGKLPADMLLKTYCSAGPKPGNLYFAYEYEAMTQGGWAYNVVNSADWVPEMPFSIQTVNDMNITNPFVGADAMIKKQPLVKRLVMRHVYNGLSKPAIQAQKNYEKYLGKLAANTVKKNLNGYVSPEYYKSSHYVRTGSTIVLLADSTYYTRYPDSKTKIFTHHLHPPYLYLTMRQFRASALTPVADGTAPSPLMGSWELNYLAGSGTPFENLFPDKKPTLSFTDTQRFSGSTGCNRINGALTTLDVNGIRFPDTLAMTRMACPGNGEQAFLNLLKKVNRYALSDGSTLTLISGDIAVMRFTRKQP